MIKTLNEDQIDSIAEQIAAIAMGVSQFSEDDWAHMPESQEDTYKDMAATVLLRINSVAEDERAVVAMATMTKLLVDNLMLSEILKTKVDKT